MANIFDKAKEIRKAHPRMSWNDAVSKAGKVMKKETKVAGFKKKAVGKKPTVGKKRVGAITQSVIGTVRKKAVGGVGRAKQIVGKIDKLEAQRKKETNRLYKDIIQLEINKEHDKLDALKRQLKKNS